MNAFFCLDCRMPIELDRHGYCSRCGSDAIAPSSTGSGPRRAGVDGNHRHILFGGKCQGDSDKVAIAVSPAEMPTDPISLLHWDP